MKERKYGLLKRRKIRKLSVYEWREWDAKWETKQRMKEILEIVLHYTVIIITSVTVSALTTILLKMIVLKT